MGGRRQICCSSHSRAAWLLPTSHVTPALLAVHALPSDRLAQRQDCHRRQGRVRYAPAAQAWAKGGDAPHIPRPPSSSSALAADNGTYTDAAYPTVIVTGAPGDQEVDPRTCSEVNQVYCSGNYGYGWFTAVNATAAHWTWKTTVPVQGSPDAAFSDDLWFVKTA